MSLLGENEKVKIDQVVLSGLFEHTLSKAQRTQIAIVEAAIENYATIGYENTTFEKIATTCEVSRPLILHYFKKQEDILYLAAKYIRSNMQKIAVEAIQNAVTYEDKLAAYVHSTFEWVKGYESHVKVWLFFFYQTSINKKIRKLNSDLVDMGHMRIKELLEAGKKARVFKTKDTLRGAKKIQNVITGMLMSVMTEDSRIPLNQLRTDAANLCLKIAKSP